MSFSLRWKESGQGGVIHVISDGDDTASSMSSPAPTATRNAFYVCLRVLRICGYFAQTLGNLLLAGREVHLFMIPSAKIIARWVFRVWIRQCLSPATMQAAKRGPFPPGLSHAAGG